MFVRLTDFKDENKKIGITGQDTIRAAVTVEVPSKVLGEPARLRTTLFCADGYTFDVRETPEEIEKAILDTLIRATKTVEKLM